MVEHQDRHHTVVLAELSLDTRLDRSSRDIIKLNVCKNSKVPCFRCLIGRTVKTYDYINRIVLTLPLSVYEGTWTTLSLSLLCITMILRVRRKILKLLRSPTVASEPRFYALMLYARVEHK